MSPSPFVQMPQALSKMVTERIKRRHRFHASKNRRAPPPPIPRVAVLCATQGVDAGQLHAAPKTSGRDILPAGFRESHTMRYPVWKNDHKEMLRASIFSRRQSPCIAAQAEAAYVPGRNSLRKVDGEAATVFMPLWRGKPWFEPRRHGE